MTCELITGTAGSEHISSADDGSMFASVFGPGRYAVKQGNDLAATLVNANSVQIGTGAGFIDGRYWRITAAETVSIDSGAQGLNRIDLIGIKYLYDSGTGAETCSIAVVKGSAVSGDPSVPTYTDGNVNTGASEAFFPLYSVTITGVTPANPVKLFKVLGTTVSCPWPVGAVLQMTNGNDPNDAYPGTTWAQIQGKFLLGSSSSYTLGNTGGSATVTLTEGNLPSHAHTYDKANATSGGTSITKAQLPSGVTGSFKVRKWTYDGTTYSTVTDASGVFSSSSTSDNMDRLAYGGVGEKGNLISFNLGGSGSAHSHSVGSTSTTSGSVGSGTAVNNMPPYKVVNMWERTA